MVCIPLVHPKKSRLSVAGSVQAQCILGKLVALKDIHFSVIITIPYCSAMVVTNIGNILTFFVRLRISSRQLRRLIDCIQLGGVRAFSPACQKHLR